METYKDRLESYFHPKNMKLVEEMGYPENILVETPYSFYWAFSGMRMSAEDFLFDTRVSIDYTVKVVGQYGNDYIYRGVWKLERKG